MFCYQCEQTAKGTGCTAMGVCGKDPECSDLQDLLIHAAKGISIFAQRAARNGRVDPAIDRFVVEALFTTVTNVNFDAATLADRVRAAVAVRERARELAGDSAAVAAQLPAPATWQPAADDAGLAAQGAACSPARRAEQIGAAAAGLEDLILLGLKGAAAYVDHALVLGHRDQQLGTAIHEALDFLARDHAVEELVAMALSVGGINLRAMELLDRANTTTFGHPRPTSVRTTPVAGKAILVSGHDLLDLKVLLEQTAGTGIKIYTHGEMLPAHGYPELNRHPHLAGNYGGAWQDQRQEFEAFPGAILMTTNCIQKPRGSYQDRLFTCGLVRWPGVRHIEGRDFAPVIAAALGAEGFAEDAPEHRITVGFGHDAVLSLAGQVVGAVKSGAVRRFFLVGGCDGARPGRNYYTDFARAVPDDCVILTLACGKYRFNKLDFGQIGAIPRLLDIGQCNDAYSAIRIAGALAEAFGTDVNGLPLSLVLSWYEQKAVAILLTLLHLGVRNIRIGPSLPAFLAPPVLETLVKLFGLKPITTPEADLAACLAGE